MRIVGLEQIGRRLAQLEAEPLATDQAVDRARFDWFADSCPCGKPPGECVTHPRARPNQRPPEGTWGTLLWLAGRGFGKTRCGVEVVRHWIESGECRRVAIVAPTASDLRDVIVEGPAGVLAVCPDWNRPKYEPSKRRLTWPNGAIVTLFSAEEPDRLRGPQHDGALADEIAAWPRPETLDNLLMGLRLGENPKLVCTTTPRPTRLIRELIADPGTVTIKGTTYDNRLHLSPKFFDTIVRKFEGTRLGAQELLAEILEISEGVIFPVFDPARHVVESAEYDPRFPVLLAIDAGVSRHTAAVWLQVQPVDAHRRAVTVFGDWHADGPYSEAAAKAIKAHGETLPCRGRLDVVRLDPAAGARTGIGPAAYSAFELVFGSRITARWPLHKVADGVDAIDLLLDQGCLAIHPRCAKLRTAFLNYTRKAGRNGEWLDEPVDPQHPHEDLMDALRGGIRDRFPEGVRVEQPRFQNVHFSRMR